jgi:fermentation-respiration switch protein FrsA (DUF1100 family)
VALIVVVIALITGLVAWLWSTELIKRHRPDEFSSPAEYGLPFTQVLFSSNDGIGLHGWFIPGEGVGQLSLEDVDWAEGSKGTVVFCHGRFGSKDPDLKYVPWFHRVGYNTFLFDFRGHGRSEGSYTSFGLHERKDLMAALDLLHNKGISAVGVIGFSLGGAVAISTAAQRKEIGAMIADGAFVALRSTLAAGARERRVPSWMIRYLGPFIIWLAGRRVGGDLEEWDPIRWVDRIAPRPLLIIHGGRDQYVATEDVRRLYEKAGEPKELWIVDEAGHRQVEEMYPDEYRKRVLAFFDRYLAATSREESR